MASNANSAKSIVLITGTAGNIGKSLAERLTDNYRVVGLDRSGTKAEFPLFEANLGDDKSVEQAIAEFRDRLGEHRQRRPPRRLFRFFG